MFLTLAFASTCNRIILNVTREGNRLKVIEIISGEAGSSIAQRQNVFKGILWRVGQGIGTAKSDGEALSYNIRTSLSGGVFARMAPN
jgi:hypothetical protein